MAPSSAALSADNQTDQVLNAMKTRQHGAWSSGDYAVVGTTLQIVGEELVRVCKTGGKIGFANWTPEGFIGQVFKTLGKYLPPPAGAKSPALWGTQARITEMFGAAAASIRVEKRHFAFRYRSPEHFLD